LSDELPRRIGKIEEEVSNVQQVVGGVKTEIAVVKEKIDGQDKHLKEIKEEAKLQTNILNKLLTLTDRHDNFEREFKVLKEDYNTHKEEIIKLVGTMRGIVLAGAIFVGMIIGMGLYIYSDKMIVLQAHETRIHALEVK
jgi:predicted  nucleic acid-binding Zn-ribbon protein